MKYIYLLLLLPLFPGLLYGQSIKTESIQIKNCEYKSEYTSTGYITINGERHYYYKTLPLCDMKGTQQFFYDNNDEKVRHGKMTLSESGFYGTPTLKYSQNLSANFNKGELNGLFTYKYFYISSNNAQHTYNISGYFENGEPTKTWNFSCSNPKINISATFKDNKLVTCITQGISLNKVNNLWNGKFDNFIIKEGMITNKYYDTKGQLRDCETPQKTLIDNLLLNKINEDSLVNYGFRIKIEYTYRELPLFDIQRSETLYIPVPSVGLPDFTILEKITLLSYEEAVNRIDNGSTLPKVLQNAMSTDTRKKIVQYSCKKILTDVESLISSESYQDAQSLLETLIPSALNEEQKKIVEDKKIQINQKIFEKDIEYVNSLIQKNQLSQASNYLKQMNCQNEEQKNRVEEKQKEIQSIQDFIKRIQTAQKKINDNYAEIEYLVSTANCSNIGSYVSSKKEVELIKEELTNTTIDINRFENLAEKCEQITEKTKDILKQLHLFNDIIFKYQTPLSSSKKNLIKYYNEIFAKERDAIKNYTDNNSDELMKKTLQLSRFQEQVLSINSIPDTKVLEKQLKKASSVEEATNIIMEYNAPSYSNETSKVVLNPQYYSNQETVKIIKVETDNNKTTIQFQVLTNAEIAIDPNTILYCLGEEYPLTTKENINDAPNFSKHIKDEIFILNFPAIPESAYILGIKESCTDCWNFQFIQLKK